MKTSSNKIKEEIFDELEDLKEDNLKEVLDFVCFLKVKKAIDPSQAYFWTNEWQNAERKVNKEIAGGRVRSFDRVKDFVADLHDADTD